MKKILISLALLSLVGCESIPEKNTSLSQSELRSKYKSILPKVKNSYTGTPDDVSGAQCRGELVSLSLECGSKELESEVIGGNSWSFKKAPHISCREYMDDYSNNRLDFVCK